MDEAGVDKAAIVHSSTTYGYDNSYMCDFIATQPKRFTGVGSVDFAAPDASRKDPLLARQEGDRPAHF